MARQQEIVVRDVPARISRVGRWLAQIRSYWGPSFQSNSHDPWSLTSTHTATGIPVTEWSALNYSAVWSAVELISAQVGNLPLPLYRKDGQNKTKFESHPLYRILHDRPNPEMSAFVFREILQAHVLLWGNAYAEIERNGGGRPAALWPLTPDRVTPYRRSYDAALQYRVIQPDNSVIVLDAADVIHICGLGYDGVCGYSVVSKARESFSLGLATERFGGTFFGNGATFGGVISYPGPKPPELADQGYRDALNARHQGVERAHKLLALYNGAKYDPVGVPPDDAQFLETRKFQVEEIARWFNLPPHKLKELTRSTNNNIEHQNLEYYIDCLSPWLERWEQELSEKLIAPSERNLQAIEFTVEGLLRGDSTARGEFHSKEFSVASVTPNEVRGIENRNAIAGGDDAFVAMNLIPLGLARPYWEASIEEKRANIQKILAPPPAPPPTPDPQQQRQIDTLTEERDLARKKAQEAEDAKDLAASQLRSTTTILADVRIELKATTEALEQQRTERAEAWMRAEQCAIDRDAARTKIDTQEATIIDLRAANLSLVTEHQRADEDAVALKVTIGKLEVERESLLVTGAAEREGRAQASAARAALERTVLETQQAIRGIAVDVLERLLFKESERARKHVLSVEKFTRWIDGFYGPHAEYAREALTPVLAAWRTLQPAGNTTEAAVAVYLEDSRRQLSALLAEVDDDTLPAALERVLHRWEIDRAEALVTPVLGGPSHA